MEHQAAKKKITNDIPEDGKIKYTKQERDVARREVEKMLSPMLNKGKKQSR